MLNFYCNYTIQVWIRRQKIRERRGWGHKVGFPSCNEDKIDNVVKREYNNREDLEVVICDLTYVNVAGKWTIYVY